MSELAAYCAARGCRASAGFTRYEGECGSLVLHAHAQLARRDEIERALGRDQCATDAALILDAYRKWGVELTDHLTGDFSIVIEDRAKGIATALRDHIGSWPLFYSLAPSGKLLFSDDLAALKDAIGDCALDDSYVVSALLGGRRTPLDRTFYQALRRLPAGHRLEVKSGTSRATRWWHPFEHPQLADRSIDSLVEEGRTLLRDAIADRIDATHKTGIHVTGGLDSSSILGLGLPLLRGIGSTAVGFAWQEPANTDEGPRVAAAVKMAGIELHAPKPDLAMLDGLWRQDWASGPSQWNLLHELAVQRAAQDLGVSRIFSGWGGDEAISFNGRGLHGEYLAALRFGKLASLSPRAGLPGLASAVRTGLRELARPRLQTAALSPQNLLSGEALASCSPSPAKDADLRSCRSAMRSILDLGTITARIEDWAMSGREHGIEYRYPLLDRRVMEFAYRLPSGVFRRGTTGRWFFREMMRGMLPDPIRCERSKAEDLRSTALIELVQQSFRSLASEVRDRRNAFARAHYFDMDRLIAALESPPGIGDPALGQLRRAIQFLDL
ncbi:MAG: hypothetical protein H6920_11580 [Sphingomonadaceae bacterium]|nr:hypothetical protein [Sphingomonadaceae bacterium]MCP5392248.1 hypothetical protein [Sphingomonadaceae bacterium]MCP5393560.1 hypothetical protein [Sphingomonadaceae bacterium]